MPKKVDYGEELKALKDEPDGVLRQITSRVSVGCLKKLYQVCYYEKRDLGALCRQILEEQVDRYVAPAEVRSPPAAQASPMRAGMAWGTVLGQLPAGVRELVEKVCVELAVDPVGLITGLLVEGLPHLA